MMFVGNAQVCLALAIGFILLSDCRHALSANIHMVLLSMLNTAPMVPVIGSTAHVEGVPPLI